MEWRDLDSRPLCTERRCFCAIYIVVIGNGDSQVYLNMTEVYYVISMLLV